MSTSYPPCINCGSTSYMGRGGSFGGSLSHQWFECEGCGQKALSPSHQPLALFIFATPDMLVERERSDEHPLDTWINKVFLPTCRDYVARYEKHKTMEWEAWLAEVFFPRFPEYVGRWDAGTIKYHELSVEAQAVYNAVFGDDAGRPSERVGRYRPLPTSLLAPPYPPKFPSQYVAYYQMWASSQTWYRIDPLYSASVAVPEDPVLVNNREFFASVREKIGREIGSLPPFSEAKNEYGGIEPWYTFTYGNANFKVGWRKRVVNIEVEYPSDVSTHGIRQAALADKVTYSVEGPPIVKRLEEMSGWDECDPNGAVHECLRRQYPEGTFIDTDLPSDSPTARKITVHAWSRDKTVEYLSHLLLATQDLSLP
jgi:hypothetical protein